MVRYSVIECINELTKEVRACRPVDGTSMNEECEAVMVDHQVCAVRFLT